MTDYHRFTAPLPERPIRRIQLWYSFLAHTYIKSTYERALTGIMTDRQVRVLITKMESLDLFRKEISMESAMCKPSILSGCSDVQIIQMS